MDVASEQRQGASDDRWLSETRSPWVWSRPMIHASPSAERRNLKRKTRPPLVFTEASRMQGLAFARRAQGDTIGFVPTMGALHSGHEALFQQARSTCDLLVVSIFVNPLQFNDREDLECYPTPREADLQVCQRAGVDVVFMPSARVMYPEGFQTTLKTGPLARRFEGKVRKGHFDGVVTVVASLFNIVQPHFAVFGEKDFQQLAIVRRMVRDLHMPVEIVPMPVLREVDGLALSSRNAHLSKKNRAKATVLFNALEAAQASAAAGERRASRIKAAARRVLKTVPELELEYLAVVDPTTLEPVDLIKDQARLLLAGAMGKRPRTHLLDNGPLFVGTERV